MTTKAPTTDNGAAQAGATEHKALPLGREHMPTDYSISLDAYTGRGTDHETRIPEDFGPKQDRRGFESTSQNIIDYIVLITYRIWEHPDVEYIRSTYSDNSLVYDDYGLQRGAEKIIKDTYHTTGAFSDIQLIADEVIWAGNDEIGFHTSHRTIIRGTNDGDSNYGPATHKTVDVLVIANCVALENRIFLEHVCYNTSSMIQQLGLSLEDQANKLAASPPPGWPRDAASWQGAKNAARPDQPISVSSPIEGFDVDRFSRSVLDQLWNHRAYEVLSTCYDPNFTFAGPTDRAFSGLNLYREFLSSISDAFPDLELEVDEVYWMGNDSDGYLTSERWSATGTHTGDGTYGAATGRPVRIWGITQHKIVNGRIVAEWMLFNELDLMMQLSPAAIGSQ